MSLTVALLSIAALLGAAAWPSPLREASKRPGSFMVFVLVSVSSFSSRRLFLAAPRR